jgi:hypothetical protein
MEMCETIKSMNMTLVKAAVNAIAFRVLHLYFSETIASGTIASLKKLILVYITNEDLRKKCKVDQSEDHLS